jgi:hypothetical protein
MSSAELPKSREGLQSGMRRGRSQEKSRPNEMQCRQMSSAPWPSRNVTLHCSRSPVFWRILRIKIAAGDADTALLLALDAPAGRRRRGRTTLCARGGGGFVQYGQTAGLSLLSRSFRGQLGSSVLPGSAGWVTQRPWRALFLCNNMTELFRCPNAQWRLQCSTGTQRLF